MHTIHHTHAFVLRQAESGEANRRVWLFTEEFGLVVAVVQGVRKVGAKLQMQLVDYAFVSVDLVRGRDVWRLVSISSAHAPLLHEPRKTLARSFVRSLGAVERFCHGEEANPALFAHLVACQNLLGESGLDERAYDTVSLWKVMTILGYGSVTPEVQPLFEAPLREAVQMLTDTARKQLVRDINEVIEHTHL